MVSEHERRGKFVSERLEDTVTGEGITGLGSGYEDWWISGPMFWVTSVLDDLLLVIVGRRTGIGEVGGDNDSGGTDDDGTTGGVDGVEES